MLLKPFLNKFTGLRAWLAWKYDNIRGDPEKSRELAKKLIEENDIESPEKVAFFLAQKMNYVSDPLWGMVDIQQDLDRTIDRGWRGDCDDYSLAAYRLLEQLGYKPYLLTLLRKASFKLQFRWPPIVINWPNHVVCIFKKDKKWHLIGNEGYQTFTSFEKMLEKKEAINYSKDRLGR